MQLVLNILIGLVMAGVVVILLMGLWNMVRGGSGNTSQKLMRARVIGQAVALALLLLALYLFGNGNHPT
ncbi:MAG TPA: twin transmembrane helix small protein [Devosia sp.]|nr:twin transmembrane helix small protein [Devosia sp.]